MSRQPRRRRARFDARAAPRAARRRPRLRRVVLRAVRRGAALPGASRPRSADPARSVPARTRRDGHVRLGLARPARRPRSEREGGGRAHRHRPPRVEPAVRHDQRHRSDGRRERRVGAPARRRAWASRSPATPRSASTPRSCATPAGSSTSRRRPRCSTSPASSSAFDLPIARLCRTLFEEHRFAYLQLLADGARGAELVPEKRFVWAKVTQADLARHGVSFEEVEGLIDVVRRTREAEVACVLKEAPDGGWRVSLRSLGDVDVCRIAEHQGGGGHRFAAGFTSDEPRPTRSCTRSSRSSSGRAPVVTEPTNGLVVPTDGLVVVDKPAGWTSHDVVGKLRRFYGQRRVGHAGTLDPDATGVLLVGLGRVTRLLRFLQETTKAYRARVVFGVATDTLDASGRGARTGGDAADARAGGAGGAVPSSARSSRSRRWCRRSRSTASALRAGAPRRGGRAHAAPGADRPLDGRGVRARRLSRGHRRGRLLERDLRPLASPPISASRSAAARTSPSCGGSRVGSFAVDEAHPLEAIEADPPAASCSRHARRCATSRRSSCAASEVRAVAHGATFAARALVAGRRGRRAVRGRRRRTSSCSPSTSAEVRA